jgi:hypothetical protein
MFKKNTILIAILSIILVILLLVGRYQINKQASDIRRFQGLVKIQNTEIERSHTEVITNKKAIKELSEQVFQKDKKIKEVYALLQTATKTVIKDLPLTYVDVDTLEFHDTLYITKENRDSFIRVPVKAKFQDKNLYVGITIKKTGVNIDSLSLNDTTSIRIVKRKKGLFKSEYLVETVRTSPYTKTTNQQSFIFKPKISLWNKIIKPVIFYTLGILTTKI